MCGHDSVTAGAYGLANQGLAERMALGTASYRQRVQSEGENGSKPHPLKLGRGKSRFAAVANSALPQSLCQLFQTWSLSVHPLGSDCRAGYRQMSSHGSVASLQLLSSSNLGRVHLGQSTRLYPPRRSTSEDVMGGGRVGRPLPSPDCPQVNPGRRQRTRRTFQSKFILRYLCLLLMCSWGCQETKSWGELTN